MCCRIVHYHSSGLKRRCCCSFLLYFLKNCALVLASAWNDPGLSLLASIHQHPVFTSDREREDDLIQHSLLSSLSNSAECLTSIPPSFLQFRPSPSSLPLFSSSHPFSFSPTRLWVGRGREEEGDQSHPVVYFPLLYFPLLHCFNTLDHVGHWPTAPKCVYALFLHT